MNIDPSTASPEDLLAALTVRDLAADDPRVAVRFAVEPDLEERWSLLAATIEELTATAGDGSPPLASAAVPAIDTLAAIRAFRREPITTAPPRRWLPVLGTAIAAALLLVWLLWPPTATPDDPRLGGTATTLAPDAMAWPEGVPLRWQPVRGAESYRLELRPLPDGPTITIPDSTRASSDLTTTEWLPSALRRTSLPERFRWRVIAIDSSNTPVATSPWAETWR